jgi:hypothetical protein
MTGDVKYISNDTTFKELSELLDSIPDVYEVPLVSDRGISIFQSEIFIGYFRKPHETSKCN